MGGTGVIDNFLGVFTSYIDSGFGLLGGEVAFIATTLIVIDVTLAALFWSWGADDDIIARLVKKTLFIGVFAYLIGNWNNLAQIIFDSFAGLGLKGSGTSFSAADLLRPGEWLVYTVDVKESGTYAIDIPVASNKQGGTFHIEFDGVDRTKAISVPDTGGWKILKMIQAKGVKLEAGVRKMRVVMDSKGPSGSIGDIDHFHFKKTGP